MRWLQVLDQELIVLIAVRPVELHFGVGRRARVSLRVSMHQLPGLIEDQRIALKAHLLISSCMLAALGAFPVWLLQNHEYTVIIRLRGLQLLFQIHFLPCKLLVTPCHLQIGALRHFRCLDHRVARLDARLLDLRLLSGGLTHG